MLMEGLECRLEIHDITPCRVVKKGTTAVVPFSWIVVENHFDTSLFRDAVFSARNPRKRPKPDLEALRHS